MSAIYITLPNGLQIVRDGWGLVEARYKDRGFCLANSEEDRAALAAAVVLVCKPRPFRSRLRNHR